MNISDYRQAREGVREILYPLIAEIAPNQNQRVIKADTLLTDLGYTFSELLELEYEARERLNIDGASKMIPFERKDVIKISQIKVRDLEKWATRLTLPQEKAA